MYLTHDQEWRGRATDEHTRSQCDVPPETLVAPFPLRMPPEQVIDDVQPPVQTEPEVRKRAWMGIMIKWAGRVTHNTWHAVVTGLPVVAGVATGMIWNRKDVLMAPGLFTLFLIGVTWGAGKPESFADLMNQIHENAKLLRYGISQTLKTIRQWVGPVSVLFLLGVTLALFWKIQQRMQPSLKTREELTGCRDRSQRSTDESTPAVAAERGLVFPEVGGKKGTGVEEATHLSTAHPPVRGDLMKMPTLEEKELPPRQGCQAGEVRVTGCAQKRVAENWRHIVVVGKYVLLEDDVVPHQEEARSVFMCANHGRVYNETIKDKRCSRQGCWNRGCWWEKDGTWSLDCPVHMQAKIDEAGKRHEEDRLLREQMRRRKTSIGPSEPSSSSGQSNQVPPGRSAEGVAVAACPLAAPQSVTRPGKMDPPTILEDIPRQVSTTQIENDNRLEDKAESARIEDRKKTERPAAKPGIMLNVQFADELGRCKRKSPPPSEETRELHAAETSNDESPGEKMRKITAQRKGQVDGSNEGSSDGSWGEINSHLSREPKKRTSVDEPEPRRTEKRASLDPNRFSTKRAHSRNSQSSHESDVSGRRATDLFGTSKTAIKTNVVEISRRF